MEKQVELNEGYLTIGGNQVDVSGYHRVTTGRYSTNFDIEDRLPPVNYTKYMMLIGYGGQVDFNQLQQQISNAIPSELKGSIDAVVHTASDRLIDHFPPAADGIEIMVSDDVKLIVRQ